METVPENTFYTDDAAVIGEMLKRDWSLGPQNQVNVAYIPSGFMADARIGFVYVYKVSGTNRISSTDYHSLERNCTLSIRVSNPSRENHFAWCQEVYRILLANRRCNDNLGGYLFLEITGDRETNDLTAYYVTTIEVRMTRYCKPIRTAGFGNSVNKAVQDSNGIGKEQS